MAILSNINDKFRVDSAGAVYFGTSAGTNGLILKSIGTGGSPVWVDPNTVGTGPWLPLAGGDVTGNLTVGGTLGITGASTLSSTLAVATGRFIVTQTAVNPVTITGTVGAVDDVRGSLKVRDDTAMAADVGGQIALGYKYLTSGGYTEGALIRTYKLNATDGDYSSGLKIQVRNTGNSLGTKFTLDPSGNVTIPGIYTATGGTSTEWNTAYDNSITGLAVTGTTTKTLTATQQDGGTLTATWTDNDNNTSWPNVGAGIRTNYTLGLKPPASGYAGFYFETSAGAGAGYFLVRGESGTGAYTSQGISLIADAGWLSLVSRTTDDKGVRIMAGAAATIRLKIVSAGDITFNEAYTFPTADGSVNQVLKTDGSGNLDWATDANDNTTWPNVGAGTRTNYTLSFKPPTSNYAGFQFLTAAGAGAGYLLIRGTSNAGTVYKAEGISLISDTSWVTIASRTTTDAGVRLMSGATSAERLVIKDDGESYFTGNLGIGVTSPSNKLTIATGTGGGSAPDSRTQLYIDKNGEAYISINSPAESFNGIRLSVAGVPKGFMELYDNTAQGKKLNIGTVDARNIVFATSNQPKMTILSGGNVGIGVTSPNSKLQIIANQAAANPGGKNFTGSAINANGGDIATGRVFFQGNNSTAVDLCGINNETNRIVLFNYTDSRYLQYWDHAGSSYIPNGNVSIGSTSNGVRGERLFVNGEVRQQSTVGLNPLGATRGGLGAYDNTTGWGAGIGGQLVLGYIYTGSSYTEGALIKMYKQNSTQGHYGSGLRWAVRENGTNLTAKMDLSPSGTLTVIQDIVAYGSPSDKKLKENIKPISLALDKVTKLQGVTFDWKESDSMLDIKEDIGFIAQDVQKVIPELVRKNNNGLLSMRHQGVIPMLVEAIKELEARVKILENK